MKHDIERKYIYWSFMALGIILCSIVFFLAITRWAAVKATINIFVGVLTPFIWGLVIAYILTPVLNLLERKALHRLGEKAFPNDAKKAWGFSRAIGIVLSLGISIFLVVSLILLIISQLYSNLSNINRMIESMPYYFNLFSNWTAELLHDNPEIESLVVTILNNISEFAINWVETGLVSGINQFLVGLTSGVVSLLNGVLNLFIGLVVAVYVLYNKEHHGAQFRKLLYSLINPMYAENIMNSIAYVHKAFGGFLSGKILDSIIIGIICFIGLSLLNMPSTGLIAIIIGISNIIPFFGPFIGAIPSAMLILLESPVKCLVFLIFVLALQQFDGNILGPKILGSSTGLTGIWVLFAIVVGGGLFGFPGMVCGVPVFSVIYAAIKHFCDIRLQKKHLPVETAAYMAKKEDRPDKEE